jgi:3',5'-nucleoside bisphosphate phosphatase
MSACFDLQSHSIHSDGSLTPSGVVEHAARAGVRLLALTDHDTVAGVAEALAAGRRLSVAVVPAIEISAVDSPVDTGIAPARAGDPTGPGGVDQPTAGGGGSGGHGGDLHVLGYCIDPDDSALAARLAAFRADRERRARRMASALRAQGFVVEREAIDARAAAGESIGRPHLAQAVLGAAANGERLRAERIDDVGAMIGAYLSAGAPAYVARTTPSVKLAVQAIHAAGGVAVWAHPLRNVPDPQAATRTIDRLAALGVDGVEVFYPSHTRAQTELLAAYCARRGLLRTGSSDFHGPQHRRSHAMLAFDTYGIEPELGPIGAACQSTASSVSSR